MCSCSGIFWNTEFMCSRSCSNCTAGFEYTRHLVFPGIPIWLGILGVPPADAGWPRIPNEVFPGIPWYSVQQCGYFLIFQNYCIIYFHSKISLIDSYNSSMHIQCKCHHDSYRDGKRGRVVAARGAHAQMPLPCIIRLTCAPPGLVPPVAPVGPPASRCCALQKRRLC